MYFGVMIGFFICYGFCLLVYSSISKGINIIKVNVILDRRIFEVSYFVVIVVSVCCICCFYELI